MWQERVPACCEGCEAFESAGAVCRLLASPTLENRRALLHMPCDVEALLQIRFRATTPDPTPLADEAIEAWLDPMKGVDEMTRSFGRAPRDARLWLTAWPHAYLARAIFRKTSWEMPPEPGPPSPAEHAARDEHPPIAARVVQALERVRQIDGLGYAMLLDLLAGVFETATWIDALGISPGGVGERKYVAIWRYAAFLCEVPERVQPREAAVALAARRLVRGDPGDGYALEATRKALGRADVTLREWRDWYREGALKSFNLIAASEALGPGAMTHLRQVFRRVLRVD